MIDWGVVLGLICVEPLNCIACYPWWWTTHQDCGDRRYLESELILFANCKLLPESWSVHLITKLHAQCTYLCCNVDFRFIQMMPHHSARIRFTYLHPKKREGSDGGGGWIKKNVNYLNKSQGTHQWPQRCPIHGLIFDRTAFKECTEACDFEFSSQGN